MITQSIYIVRVSTLFFLLAKKVLRVQRQLSSGQRASADSGFVSRDVLFLGVLSSASQRSLPFPQQPVVDTSALFSAGDNHTSTRPGGDSHMRTATLPPSICREKSSFVHLSGLVANHSFLNPRATCLIPGANSSFLVNREGG